MELRRMSESSKIQHNSRKAFLEVARSLGNAEMIFRGKSSTKSAGTKIFRMKIRKNLKKARPKNRSGTRNRIRKIRIQNCSSSRSKFPNKKRLSLCFRVLLKRYCRFLDLEKNKKTIKAKAENFTGNIARKKISGTARTSTETKISITETAKIAATTKMEIVTGTAGIPLQKRNSRERQILKNRKLLGNEEIFSAQNFSK